ncbi:MULTISPECIES: methyltransferase domain-containing protein [unclassified Thioalkalivibrio]|uniref:methyltransferase domain-containing protein n=1 Tax=unclassified Thioalkalivibrio TaxID=2621013 RepID=UPI000477E118|nr:MULTISPECIES: methyltransferase domain-containing protein [unclassified Thioalkalivibrio]
MRDPFANPNNSEARPTQGMAVDVGFTLDWVSAEARHRECLFLPWLEPERDRWPGDLGAALRGWGAGAAHKASREAAAALVPQGEPDRVLELPASAFNRDLRRHRRVEPRAGRFYPRAFLAGHAGIEAGDRELFRIGALEGDHLVADLNHPLAGHDLRLQARVMARHEVGRDDERAVDVARLLTARGPGMQARWRGRPTDFWVDGALGREDPESDAVFYAAPRRVHHLDATARAEIAALYGACIPPGARVLDLMSSWESHLDRVEAPEAVIGLGMNAEELADNPRLTSSLVHDLNLRPELPYAAASFDAVVCTASVEYLTQPEAVFRAVREVLRPDGVFMVTFSDRCFPTKAIAAWEPLYDFERMGLVLDVFLRAGFVDLSTFSLRGLPRPPDDPYAGRLGHADPVFAVWGRRP